MVDLIVLDFLRYMGASYAYGWLVSESSLCSFSDRYIMDAWLDSKVGVVVVDSIVIGQSFSCKKSFMGGIFSELDWGVELKGGSVIAVDWFLRSLGGTFTGGGFVFSFALFRRLCTLGVLDVSAVHARGCISLTCSFTKKLSVSGRRFQGMHSWYGYNYFIFTDEGHFFVQGEDGRALSYGDFWAGERAFARLFLNSTVALSFYSYLFG